MNVQVSATVVGGRMSAATREAYAWAHEALDDAARAFRSASLGWQTAATRCIAVQQAALCCAQHLPGLGAAFDPRLHVDRCTECHTQAMQLADECARLADLVARASGIYAQAEQDALALASQGIQAVTVLSPIRSTVALVSGMVVGGIVEGVRTGSSFSFTGASRATARFQEGTIAGLGTVFAGTGTPWGSSRSRLNQGISDMARTTGAVNDMMQGNRLTVRKVDTAAHPVPAAAGIGDALHGLRLLGEANARQDDGLSYATIAISRYERQDGSSSWLVTIPGTDGQANSPFGWEQNLEAMSSDADQRRQADSVRMVTEAMRQAGIGQDDPVVLVGHSQGGIVAAAIASDCTQEFHVDHVVTAGSPIAGHPITASWVTSVEMEDELVAALDGAANPATDTWLTVRGRVTDSTAAAQDRLLAGSIVPDAVGTAEFTHNLKYHEAAWRNADDLGSPALREHDDHVRDTLAGTYQGTTYWQGRISQGQAADAADSP
ncbi:alpha/beta fold hydrolase [Bifidobacterium cuniculi]|uniref:Esterase/lipase n=1 Tax=Bifidobacterium cuniculi TaxID=1688 RepID=A0A087AX44_9BIFI|nr:alpha/beta fold hydrolase [Bifidobacterium cuniculi]KFI63344.1 esterase/lipase [Bifidobacterium cuniculi]